MQQLRVVDGAVVQRHRHLQLTGQLAAAAQVDERPAGAQLLGQLPSLRAGVAGDADGDESGAALYSRPMALCTLCMQARAWYRMQGSMPPAQALQAALTPSTILTTEGWQPEPQPQP